MHILPLQLILVLRLALISLMTNGKDAETRHILRNVKHTLNDGISAGAVRQSATTHLYPARAKPQGLSLILHRDGSNSAVFHPTVVLHGVAQHDDSQWRSLQELTTHILRLRQLLQVGLIVDNHKVPGTLTL